jgi:DNA-binding CsgD family transcriptional regulator
MATEPGADLALGGEALRAGAWARAEEVFRSALAGEETGAARYLLGDALWWQGKIAEAIHCREQAYAAFRRESDPLWAATVALRLSLDYTSNIGNPAVAAGWLARADTLITAFALQPLRGWFLMMQAFTADDPVSGEQKAREAVDTARETGDADLELMALSVLGAMLIRQGRVQEGTARLDEAMAGAVGESGSPHTVVFTGCNMIKSCTSCADFERAVQWIRVADRFMEEYACAFLYAACRSLYGAVLMATGDWVRAEAELTAAVDSALSALPAVQAPAIGALAELRMAQGRVEEAERLVTGWEDHEAVVLVVARLHLIHGRAAAAAATATRLLGGLGEERLDSGVLLEVVGEAEIARADVAAAAQRARRLTELGTRQGCRILVARGRRLEGRALAAAGDAAGARAQLDTALVAFAELGLVYEAARTRLLLAELLAGLDPEVAAVEARAALAVLDELGAKPSADAAAAFLRSLGERPSRARRRSHETLTDREQEVLVLLAEGLSNPEIAERLYLSRKTVEHHVARILAKLGVRNRAEAARLAPPPPAEPVSS